MKPRYRVPAGSRHVALADLGRARATPPPDLIEVAETALRWAKQGEFHTLIFVGIDHDGAVMSGKFISRHCSAWTLVGALEHEKMQAERRIDR